MNVGGLNLLGSSPGAMLGSSPSVNMKGRKISGMGTPGSGSSTVTFTRADINGRDTAGLTILHHAASSTSENSIEFAQALIDHPLTDLYLQDLENGWTALHRAFYFGNITIARAILDRDAENALSGKGTSHGVLGLIKIKDKEGLGPLDLYAATIHDRTLHPEIRQRSRAGSDPSDIDQSEAIDEETGRRKHTVPIRSVAGDECFTFGSNRNVTLGFGDEDDRQWPERITLRRPHHLLQRFYREHLEEVEKLWSAYDPSCAEASITSIKSSALPLEALPWAIKSKPIVIQDVFMSKLNTAVLTDDPESNLYICGHGPGGRLGLGHERTQYQFACVEGGALSGKRVASVALGQNHTLAVSDEGEIFSWGSNGYGQLGYAVQKSGPFDEDPVSTLPRQIFGLLKRETIIGVAASRIHSVAFTSSSLYTWGKNEGQLGLVDSDARSLDVQVIPRKVAASLFSSPIASVSATERATICLLASTHDVWVFTNYGYVKIQFPLDGTGFANYFLKQSFMFTNYDKTVNHITKVTSGGDTICAMSSHGEVYTLSVNQPQAAQSASASTTNPTKIKGALTQAIQIWSLKKNNMAARDVGVDADGSIIITTQEGSVWKRSRRTKIKDGVSASEYKPKDYKFSRISGLTRVIAVRSSGYGAYAAVRRDCDVTKTQVAVEERTIWKDMFPLLCFKDLQPDAVTPDSEVEEPEPRFWQGRKQPDELTMLRKQLLVSKDLEKELQEHLRMADISSYDVLLKTSVSDIALPAHRVILAGRSKTFRDGFYTMQQGGDFSIPELLSSKHDAGGVIMITFSGIDPLTLVNLVLFLYTDSIVDYWHHTRRAPALAHRYRSIRAELMKVAAQLKLNKLEPAVRQMIEPARALYMDMEVAFKDQLYFEYADAVVQLADEEIPVHSTLLCQRCPFFEGLFIGRAGGRWLDERRNQLSDSSELVEVDLKHIESNVFKLVLRHIYADTGEELFDDIVSADSDEFLDFVMEVMSVANELMMDRLAQICQKVVGRYVNVRNVSGLLNAIAPSSVSEFKDAGLEYMCLSLEAVLHGRYLDELDEDLLLELDDVVRSNQLALMPFAKSGRAEEELLERHPELPALLARDRQAKVDALNIRAKYQDLDPVPSSSFRGNSLDEDHASPSQQRMRRKSSALGYGRPSPALKGKEAVDNLGLSIDEDTALDLGAPAVKLPERPSTRPQDAMIGSPPVEDIWYDNRGKQLSPALRPLDHKAASPSQARSPVLAPNQSTPSRPSAAPWGATPSPGAKLELKDIMSQASSSRVSNLSLGLAAAKQTSDTTVPTVAGSVKMSQKERKRIQLQQQQAMASELSRPPSSDGSRSSPWQTVQSGQKIPSLKDVMSTDRKPSPLPSAATASPPPSKPQLTMRQTVANPKPTSNGKAAASTEAIAPQPVRTVSSPVPPRQNMPRSPAVRPVASPSQRPTPPQQASYGFSKPARPPSPSEFPTIQSIRHQPRPVEPSLQLSMSDILFQQQAEKEAIREAAAARSLQDIQAEQEFQEWWDKEAKRLQGLQEGGPPKNASKRGGKRGVGARGKRNGVATDAPRKDNPAEGAHARGGGEARGRGRGR